MYYFIFEGQKRIRIWLSINIFKKKIKVSLKFLNICLFEICKNVFKTNTFKANTVRYGMWCVCILIKDRSFCFEYQRTYSINLQSLMILRTYFHRLLKNIILKFCAFKTFRTEVINILKTRFIDNSNILTELEPGIEFHIRQLK